jgi:predicted 3-demethylubiquinone-9 3-methyltransferase (glyoxalase superfamily)
MNNPINPCLWFDGKAKEAAEFYCSVFDDTSIVSENPFVVELESAGQKILCLNGGPEFKFNPSLSFFVLSNKKEEIDGMWNRLLEGGLALMPLDKYDWSDRYGWVQDRYGVSWQLSLGNMKDVGQKFTISLLFTGSTSGKAEEAIKFYTSIFEGSSISGISKYTNDEKGIEGSVKHSQFKLRNQVFMAMDNPIPQEFGFNEAFSLVVNCETQAEIDYYWGKLTQGGQESMCGWLKDKYGISWQIVPSILKKLMSDPRRSDRVINAFLQMKKFEIDKLVKA